MCDGKPSMRQIFGDEDTEAVLLVDAANAFNAINRKSMLQNIKVKCPYLATFAENNYRDPSRIFITGGKEISSDEGVTQGDPAAMQMYAISTIPLQEEISMHKTHAKHVAFADDINGGGTVENVQTWWETINLKGPKYGYNPKASKSWLIVKPEKYDRAMELFKDSNVQITMEGHKQLGASLGTMEFKEIYVKEMVEEWVQEIRSLSEIAKTDPHSTYCAFVHGLRHKWTCTMRTIPNISHLFEPLENEIKNVFLAEITGQCLTENECIILSLPPRLVV